MGGKGAGNNSLADGEVCWNGVGGVEAASWLEDGWGDGNERNGAGEVGDIGRGDAAQQEDG